MNIVLSIVGFLASQSILASIARVALAAVLVYGFGWWNGSKGAKEACAAREAAAKAAVQAQVDEWKSAAEDIARDATDRVEKDESSRKAQESFINHLMKRGNENVLNPKNMSIDFGGPRFLDADYVGVVRAFDQSAGSSYSKASESAKKLRQASAATEPDRCAAVKVFALRNRAAASEANRRLRRDKTFYDDVRREFSSH